MKDEGGRMNREGGDPVSCIPHPSSFILPGSVGERSVVGRSGTARSRGRGGSANAGISSEKTGENPVRRKPKGS